MRSKNISKKISENKWKRTHNNPKTMSNSKGSTDRKVHNDTGLPKKDRKFSNKQLNPTSIRTGGTTTNKAQSE